jgi:uncharacterized PurR-regulated membrane protein YhhQ (DUF165 family)
MIVNRSNTSGRYGYNFLLLLVILYILTFPLVGLSLHKPVQVGPLHLQVSSLIYPLSFFFTDIITEVYGYQVSRQLIWCQIPGTIYYQTILLVSLYGLPIPDNWHYQSAYEYVFHGMGIVGYFGDFGLVIAFFLNNYLISKWKILLKGRYFWLRSIGASILGECIQLFIGLVGVYIAQIWTLEYTIMMYFNVIIFRILMTVFLSAPANLITFFLKRFEHTDIYDYNTNFNPFKFTIKYGDILNKHPDKI